MFCANCGKEIKDQAEFCPFCGQKKQADSAAVARAPLDEGLKRIIVFASAGILIAVLAVILIVSLVSGKKEYSIVGQWKCDEMEELDEIAGAILRKNGINAGIAEFIQGLLQEGAENVYVTFTESGEVYFSVYDFSTSSLGSFYWEKISNGKIKLDYTVEIPIYKIPVNLSFTTEYELKEDSLVLSIYGYDLHFTKIE